MTDTSREAVDRISIRLCHPKGSFRPSISDARDASDALRVLVAERDALEAKLEKVEAERDDAFHTLNAWFDRRELAHNAIDETVLDAVRGYLRTSRSGGMCDETSDMIEGVIADMARLSVFADLFARATLAQIDAEPAEPHQPTVKPLEWVDLHGDQSLYQTDIDHPLGYYTAINKRGDGGWWYFDRYPTLEAAKAVAQADYERRILSTLAEGDSQ